jgi:hypothetical protein
VGGEKAEDSGLYKLGVGGGDRGGVVGGRTRDYISSDWEGGGGHHVVQRSFLTCLKFERQNKKI